MKIFPVIAFLLLCHVAVNAQKMASDYFEEAGRFYESKQYDKAIDAYQYIVDHHPKNELYARAFYNIGSIYYKQEKYDKAIHVFRAILNGAFEDMERSGGDIMASPYANYKHNAGEVLSAIYYDNKKYDSALYYFTLSDTANPYLHFCGNATAEIDVYTALRYADIYQKMKQPEKAISKLLPAVFISLADNSAVIDELRKLLKKRKSDLKQQLDESLDHIYSKEIKQGSYTYTKYYFRFLDTEITVPLNYEDSKREFDKEKAINDIRQSEFYKMIQKL